MNEARVVERKSSTLKQKRNNESVKYVMENIFQILSTSSCTQIVLLYSLGSFTLLCKTDCALCKHKSPSEQILCMLSHLQAPMQQHHSAHCCWPWLVFSLVELLCSLQGSEIRGLQTCLYQCALPFIAYSQCWLWLAYPALQAGSHTCTSCPWASRLQRSLTHL